jgi:hypothetical protein
VTRSGRRAGTASIDDDDVRRAVAELRSHGRLVRRWTVAAVVGLSEAGLRSYHRRLGLTWGDFLADICTPFAPLDQTGEGDDGDMRSIVVMLDPDTAEALERLAITEERPARSQALVLLRDALTRRGALTSRKPRPIRSDVA